MNIKEQILDLLRSTGREGILELSMEMNTGGFFDAPCSTKHHLAKEGGLAEHSLNVYYTMNSLADRLLSEEEFQKYYNSIIIVSLLHDLGKMGDYGKQNFIENIIKDGRPTKEEPEQKYKRSESIPYKRNKELIPISHETRSLKIASKFINLTEEEEAAILWHNGMYGSYYRDIDGNETKLYLLLHTADMWCSRFVEVEEKGEE
ncbi:MAG: HD family phosphohydrolase [Lachnospiraceae bacterium]